MLVKLNSFSKGWTTTEAFSTYFFHLFISFSGIMFRVEKNDGACFVLFACKMKRLKSRHIWWWRKLRGAGVMKKDEVRKSLKEILWISNQCWRINVKVYIKHLNDTVKTLLTFKANFFSSPSHSLIFYSKKIDCLFWRKNLINYLLSKCYQVNVIKIVRVKEHKNTYTPA